MTLKLVLVGCGNMGHAMLTGWLMGGKLSADEVAVVEPDARLRERAAGAGVKVHADPASLGEAAPRLVVLAVKPQLIDEVAPAYRRFASQGATFLSIAAGITIARLKVLLGQDAAIIRCMPNTPAAIGLGVMALVGDGRVKDDDSTFVADLLSTNGTVAVLEQEGMMDAVTAVSGSGPAYLFHFIECLERAGVEAGLPDETARLLALQTVHGAASLAARSGVPADELRRQVTSPNGTTAAALAVLMESDRLQTAVTEAVEAARSRSIELGKAGQQPASSAQ